jgi:hypothetical protein
VLKRTVLIHILNRRKTGMYISIPNVVHLSIINLFNHPDIIDS